MRLFRIWRAGRFPQFPFRYSSPELSFDCNSEGLSRSKCRGV